MRMFNDPSADMVFQDALVQSSTTSSYDSTPLVTVIDDIVE